MACNNKTDWLNIIGTKPEDIQLVFPEYEHDELLHKRIYGSMLGMAIGDAVGACVEFRPRSFMVMHPVEDLQGGGTWGLKAGQWTDDTSMTLCLAASLINKKGFQPYDQLVRYNWWYQQGYMSSTGECFDIGKATEDSLREFSSRQQKFARENRLPSKHIDFLPDNCVTKFEKDMTTECSAPGVAGNGALMRLAPVPLFFYRRPAYAVYYAGKSALLTHGDKKAADACRYYAALICGAMHGYEKNRLLDKKFYDNAYALGWFGNEQLHQEIIDIAAGSFRQKRGYDDGIRAGGYIIRALEAALWAFDRDNNSFKRGVLLAVNLGDDTDTVAAIYGQLAGAVYGHDNLPQEWVDQIYASNFIKCLSDWIQYEGNEWNKNYRKDPAPIAKSGC
ncbi:unnamed protein product [Didymodactylos carnosus]|uniref:ADP-ribosylglycohydrolase n=1 Tax=Didymodactylos carnosus TaxID=1234261 RepID=A0A814W343_9BILA|nr:unnamed protein product [Didymodactylos carnosus]CAF3961130.1 unnamed protein product [Didymodactylos carnosus]